MNKLLVGEEPDQWSESDIKPLVNSGDLNVMDNFRGIALSSAAAKLANSMILNRILTKINPHTCPNQNGFRPGKLTVAHVVALWRLLKDLRLHKLKS